MKTKRGISINIGLSHGICNFNCITCSINKKSYYGPKKFQHIDVTKTICNRIKEAISSGVNIRNIDISGDGEPTIHPRFDEHLDEFGKLAKDLSSDLKSNPAISCTTNGSNLHNEKIIKAIERNNIAISSTWIVLKRLL